MGKNSSLIRTILFNILVILTIVFVYIFFFPKKSYVKEKIDVELNPLVDEVFSQNMSSLYIAGEDYFDNHENGRVSVSSLYDLGLLIDLKDSNGDSCDDINSYVIKDDSSMTMVLDCPDKKGMKIVEIKESIVSPAQPVSDSSSDVQESVCMYQYEKKVPASYGEWSSWSDWSTSAVSASDVRRVETKVVSEKNGSSTVVDTKNVSVDATYTPSLSCDSGYDLVNNRCVKKNRVAVTNARYESVCPNGYTMKNGACYNGSVKASLTVRYFCPSNGNDYEYVLSGDKCYKYKFIYKGVVDNGYYSCPSDYKLSGNKCYKEVSYDRQVDSYNDVTYYRYQTRERGFESVDVKWSFPDDNGLISDGYVVVGNSGCEE